MRGDRGSVTAEFAIALPAVLMVLVLAVSAIMISTQRLTLTATAAEVARLEARGDRPQAEASLASISSGYRGGIRVERDEAGPLLCVTLRAAPVAGALSAISINARGCAAKTPGPA